MNLYVVYGIYHRLLPDHIHYAGQTKVGLPKRRRGHLSAARTGSKLPSATWIRDNWDDVEFRILATADSPDKLNDLEIFWIAHLKELGQAELNLLPGGGNAPKDWVPTEELRKRWSEQRRNGGIGTSRISVEDVLEIRRLSAEGFPDKEIASLFEVGVQGVGHILRGESWGYVPWEPGTEKRDKPARVPLSFDEWDEICSRLAKGETVVSVARDLSVTRSTISRYLRQNPEVRVRYQLDSPEVVAARKQSKYLSTSKSLSGSKSPGAGMSEREAELVKRLLWLGYGQQAVSDRFGVTKNSVNLLSSGRSWRHIPWPIGPRPRPNGPKKSWDEYAESLLN